MKRSIALITICICLPLIARARAEPPRAALIVGNSTYGSFPAVPACARSANAIAAVLRARGFDVTERADASTGGIDAGISEFSSHLGDGGGAAVIYVCGYGTDYNDRTFVLPSTARITRPTDVLTQGVLAKSLLDTVGRKPLAGALVVFDLTPQPDAPPKLGLEALTGLPMKDEVAVIAAASAISGDKPTPLAAALTTELSKPVVRTDALLAGVRALLGASPPTILAVRNPARPDFLVGAPPAVKPPPLAPVVIAVPPPPVVPPVAPPVGPPTEQPPAPPRAQSELLPDEGLMTEFHRRTVQSALNTLGYYSFAVDGKFGPETRAAIRRFQHEIRVEMTGHLTSAEANRLIGNR